jgi:hypothetical protein
MSWIKVDGYPVEAWAGMEQILMRTSEYNEISIYQVPENEYIFMNPFEFTKMCYFE